MGSRQNCMLDLPKHVGQIDGEPRAKRLSA